MRVILAIVAALLVAALGPLHMPVAIRTDSAPLTVCLMARVGGQLVADRTYGLALAWPGYRQGAIWPYGWTARIAGGRIELLSAGGHVVAREGDWIEAAGGSGVEDTVHVMCSIRVVDGP